MDSQFFYLKKIIKPKSDVQVELLRPRRFFRDQDRPNWLMSHFDVICVIWRHLRHLMSNDAYDIKIWHKSIWPILVSKEASGSQQFHTLIRFWLENCFKINKLKIKKSFFPLWILKNPLYNWSAISKSEMLQENSENHGNAFFHTK